MTYGNPLERLKACANHVLGVRNIEHGMVDLSLEDFEYPQQSSLCSLQSVKPIKISKHDN